MPAAGTKHPHSSVNNTNHTFAKVLVAEGD